MAFLKPGTMRAMARGGRGQSGRSIRKSARVYVLMFWIVVIAVLLVTAMCEGVL